MTTKIKTTHISCHDSPLLKRMTALIGVLGILLSIYAGYLGFKMAAQHGELIGGLLLLMMSVPLLVGCAIMVMISVANETSRQPSLERTPVSILSLTEVSLEKYMPNTPKDKQNEKSMTISATSYLAATILGALMISVPLSLLLPPHTIKEQDNTFQREVTRSAITAMVYAESRCSLQSAPERQKACYQIELGFGVEAQAREIELSPDGVSEIGMIELIHKRAHELSLISSQRQEVRQ